MRPSTPGTSLDEYARAMKAIADWEIPDTFDPEGEPLGTLRYAVLGTYLIEPLILALRRLAHAERAAGLSRGRKRGSASRAPRPD